MSVLGVGGLIDNSIEHQIWKIKWKLKKLKGAFYVGAFLQFKIYLTCFTFLWLLVTVCIDIPFAAYGTDAPNILYDM